MTNRFLKDPDAVLDFEWDWAAWLTEDDTIVTAVVAVPDGITLDSFTKTDTAVTAWISGGSAGKGYGITCHIVTEQGREDDRTMFIICTER